MTMKKLRLAKLAELPDDLDEDSQERLDSFLFFAGSGPQVRLPKLFWLAVVSAPKVNWGEGRFKRTDDVVTLRPHTMVMTDQVAVGAKKIAYYIERFRSGVPVGTIRVTDAGPDGGLWHLDGLHRLLAARILGMSVSAEIWR
jgi:hypothetical protein